MPVIFNSSDISALSDRLNARGASQLNPSMEQDLLSASRLLRALLNRIDSAAAKANETASLLINLRVQVGD